MDVLEAGDLQRHLCSEGVQAFASEGGSSLFIQGLLRELQLHVSSFP